MDFVGVMKMERQRILHLIENYRILSEMYPGLSLYIRKVDGQERFFYRKAGESKQRYIGWKEAELLRGLLRKRNAKNKLPLLEHNLKMLDRMLKQYHGNQEIFPIEALPRETGRKRKRYPLSENTYYSKTYRHDTGLGFYCSSKSEALIARRYHAFGVPFQYEKRIRIQGADGIWKNMHPDFTIFGADREYYHEHFGMFEKSDYRMDNMQRLADYHKNDILIGRDLFITMDDCKGGIDVSAIDQFIINTILPLCQWVQ